MASKNPPTRHLISINDLSNHDVENVFETAQSFLERLPDRHFPYRIGRSTDSASEFILASLFYEPSTRTRLSFESAMLRLGGRTITSADPATSSAAKGESLADSVRVIANYADIMVIRHPRDGAARLAADYSPIPVINGGDGSHEHPTQTLCDLFTLKRKNKQLKNLKVAVSGDLRGSRTIHSFVYALARFGAHILPMPAPGMELPAHVDRRLREEFHCLFRSAEGPIGAVYQTPDEPHQPALFSEPDFEIAFGDNAQERDGLSGQKIAALYVTRFQKERWDDKSHAYPKIDAAFLREPQYSQASVMHPLPRVGELDVSLDSDSRAAYFEQAAYGVPVRMALISLMLGLPNGRGFARFEGGFEPSQHALYDQPLGTGIRCINPNCIVQDEKEAPYVRNKFLVVETEGQQAATLRCRYCETDIDAFVVASRRGKWYTSDTEVLVGQTGPAIRDMIIFANEDEAARAGFHGRRHAPARRSRASSA